jgi:hypothetical protein
MKKIKPKYKESIYPLNRTCMPNRYKLVDGKWVKIINYKHNWTLDNRDNKDRIIYTGNSGSNRIRYPKKGHKQAWKKFYKLFPSLQPGYEKPKYISEEAKQILNKK